MNCFVELLHWFLLRLRLLISNVMPTSNLPPSRCIETIIVALFINLVLPIAHFHRYSIEFWVLHLFLIATRIKWGGKSDALHNVYWCRILELIPSNHRSLYVLYINTIICLQVEGISLITLWNIGQTIMWAIFDMNQGDPITSVPSLIFWWCVWLGAVR